MVNHGLSFYGTLNGEIFENILKKTNQFVRLLY